MHIWPLLSHYKQLKFYFECLNFTCNLFGNVCIKFISEYMLSMVYFKCHEMFFHHGWTHVSCCLPKSHLTYLVKKKIWILHLIIFTHTKKTIGLEICLQNVPPFILLGSIWRFSKGLFLQGLTLCYVEMLMGLLISYAQWSRAFPLIFIYVITAVPITIVQVITLRIFT